MLPTQRGVGGGGGGGGATRNLLITSRTHIRDTEAG